MRVLLVTQNDVFYLPECIRYLLDRFPAHSRVIGAVVLDVSPFGKRETFIGKSLKTLRIFGPAFFIRYTFKFLTCKLRGPDVLAVLRERGVPILPVKGRINSVKSRASIAAQNPDLIISIAGNQIFKQRLLSIPPKGVLNLHSALLPQYRGLMPSFWVLKNGEKQTGVSVFFVDEGIDSGPIIVQKELEIGSMTQEQLIERTKKLGMDAIIEAVDAINAGGYQLLPNDDAQMSYYSFPTREDVLEFLRKGKRFY